MNLKQPDPTTLPTTLLPSGRTEYRRPLWRVVSVILILVQLCSIFPVGLWAADLAAAQSAQRPPDEVRVNRTIPPHSPAASVAPLKNDPTDEEISALRLFPHRLVPVEPQPKSAFGGLFGNKSTPQRSAESNEHAVKTLRTLQQSADPNDLTTLEQFIASHPQSRWAASLKHELSRRKFQQGYFKESVAGWQLLWDELKDRRDPSACDVADEALAQLLEAFIGLGDAKRLSQLIGEQAGRPGNGLIEAKFLRAKQAVWLYKHRGSQNVMCGALALYTILDHQGKKHKPIRLNDVTEDHIATGLSLAELKGYAEKLGLDATMVRRTNPNSRFPAPSVFHLPAGHYAAIVAAEGDKYFVVDRAMQFQGWVSQAALNTQVSGYFLVVGKHPGAGWEGIPESEGANIFGRDGLHGVESTGQAATEGSPAVGGDCNQKGMPGYTLNPKLGAIRIDDTPLGYSPPVGPPVFFRISYNDGDDSKPASAPTYPNVGRMWSINWVAYIDHISGSVTSSSRLTAHLSGGGTEVSSYNTTTGQFGFNDRSFATITRGGPNLSTYTRTLPDGSTEIYNTPNNPINPTRVFLTQKIDPQGNSLSFTYDANLRLVAVTDSIGQVTTLQYTNTWKVAKVTDPFGRFATFAYDSAGNLTNVTDVIGLSSSFTYGAAEFITSMTTPYGTTAFTKVNGASSWDRTVTATDPNGDRERVQYIEPISVPFSGPSIASSYNVRGSNIAFYADNDRLAYRNSFFWSKKAMRDAPDNINAARSYRWFTGTGWLVTPILEAVKEPFEDRVWFNYPGQILGEYSYAGGLPEKTLRFLPGGIPQLSQSYYNARGKPTRLVDPLGRETTFRYAADLLDPIEVLQFVGGTNYQRLASFSWNAQHLPLTATNASGQVTSFTYNTRGQPLTVVNPRGETAAFNYNTNGYLISVNGPLSGTNDLTTFTYDGYGRPRTVTGPDGYSVTFDYDHLDRKTKVTYPDETYEEFTYNRLDLTTVRDRLGRVTTSTYDNLRRVIQVQDPLNRVTRFDWCKCGSLNALIDPLGRTTQWLYDLQGRTTAKVYADGSKIRYLYETNTSRLKQVIDEKGQVTTYHYNADDSIAQITYSNAPIATPSVAYTYDTNYSRTVSMTDGTGTTTYSYHAVPQLGANQVSAVDGPLPNDTVTYFYDQLGRMTNRAINGVATVAAFDALGRVTSSTNALGSFSYSYDGPTTRLLSATYPNGQTSTFGYYGNAGDRRLQSITNAAGGTLLSRFAYAYNAVGNITNWTQQLGAATPFNLVCSYDAVDQLTSVVKKDGANTLKTYAYTYDLAANRTSETIDGQARQFSYNVLNEIATGTGTNTPTTYEWDAVHRLVSINQGTNRSEFSYDGLGRRVRIVEKQSGTVVDDRRFVWCELEISEERDATGAIVQKRHFPQGTQLTGGAAAGRYYYARDHLGSLREMINALGNVSARYDYEPYGRRIHLNGNLETDWGFTSHLFHPQSALHLAPYRAYDSAIGRWLSRDPVASAELLPEGPNLYSYVANNPINLSDPTGQFIPIIVAAGAALWTAAEISLSTYDAYDTARTLLDPCKSGRAKFLAGGLFLAGLVLPGGGYSKLDDFKGGGSWLMDEAKYLAYVKGRPMVGRADGQFMTSSRELNDLLLDVGDDPIALGKRLGVEGWTENTKLIRIDVLDPLRFNPRLPDQSMTGANSLFLPGGKTIGGVSEIVTDPIPAASVWATPLRQ